jgi:Zn-dependent peptidase ImmA (M78 family)
MFQRGFKTWCEKVALEMRAELGLSETDPLSPDSFSEYLGVRLWTPATLRGLSSEARKILAEERDNWSAVTVSYNGVDAVIYNDAHRPRRRSSDIMHELAHLVIGHDPSTVLLSQDGVLALRSFSREQEAEAGWLAGCLLVPRPALVFVALSGMGLERACDKYGVSRDLLRYRLNITGVSSQMRRRQRKG